MVPLILNIYSHGTFVYRLQCQAVFTMIVQYFKFFVLFALIVLGYVFAIDYCNPKLCHGLKHIACNNPGNFARRCGAKVSLLNMNEEWRKLILHLHNTKRNDVALGRLKGFAPAAKMSVLKWDRELANLAELNVKTCQMQHDQCRNTDQYRFAGQNIGIRKTSPEFLPHADSISYIVNMWFEEYKNCNQTYIDGYRKHPNKSKKIGHFTELMNDRCMALGCAAALYESGPAKDKTFLITCNYSSTNIRNRPVYQRGPTGSKCRGELSGEYSGLCAN